MQGVNDAREGGREDLGAYRGWLQGGFEEELRSVFLELARTRKSAHERCKRTQGGDSNTVNRAPGVETFAEELLEGLDMRGGEGGGGHDAWSGAGELGSPYRVIT